MQRARSDILDSVDEAFVLTEYAVQAAISIGNPGDGHRFGATESLKT